MNGGQKGAGSWTKTRNGCLTCKKRRLKCDETKPRCLRCQNARLVCDGYTEKEYKWRISDRAATPAQRRPRADAANTADASRAAPQPPKPLANGYYPRIAPAAARSVDESSALTGGTPSDESSHPSRLPQRFPDASVTHQGNKCLAAPTTASSLELLPMADLIPPSTAGDGTRFSSWADSLYIFSSTEDVSTGSDMLEVDKASVEETLRMLGNTNLVEPETMLQISARPASISPVICPVESQTMCNVMPVARVRLSASSPEMLMMQFDQETCGILSVKDGPSENPWRTVISPFAHDSPALYHGISAMAAIHGSYHNSDLKVQGIIEATESINSLRSEIEGMHLSSALATSLVLAFIDGWELPSSSGTQHLHGARALVTKAIDQYGGLTEWSNLTAQENTRLRCLYNTFVYLDVLARLTSLEEVVELVPGMILPGLHQGQGDLAEVDPLMGCAVSLFPLVGRVAKFIQQVRKSRHNDLHMVSEACGLKEDLQRWRAPGEDTFECLEDPNSHVSHCVRTAEALRLAMLLYLHQAVPEVPSDSAGEIAQQVLLKLACVPSSSRATNMQIFPLFIASCETTGTDNREWVADRWKTMAQRLKVRNVDRCWEIVQDVWERRDTALGASSKHQRRTKLPLNGELGPEYTVRGRLHWLSVMQDRKWEVFLG